MARSAATPTSASAKKKSTVVLVGGKGGGRRRNNGNGGGGGGKGGKRGRNGNGGDGGGKGGTQVSPCLDVNKCLQEEAVTDAAVDEQFENLRAVYDILLKVRESTDHKKLTEILNHPSRRCLPRDLDAAVEGFRKKLEDIDTTIVPKINERARYLLALKERRSADDQPFTDNRSVPLKPDVDGDRMRRLLARRRLHYKGFSLMRTLQSINAQLVGEIKRQHPDCTPNPFFRQLFYDTQDKAFYAYYACQDSAAMHVVKFGISGGSSAQDPKFLDWTAFDATNKVLLWGDGSVAAGEALARRTKDHTASAANDVNAVYGGARNGGRQRGGRGGAVGGRG